MIEFFTLFSSSSGNCTYLTDGDISILIDAGVSAKRIVSTLNEKSIDIKSIDAILITHEHSDHTSGVDVLSRKYKIPIFANQNTLSNMKLSNESSKMANIFKTNTDFSIGDLKINAFKTPHDTPEPVGFVFETLSNGRKLGYASDLGHISLEVSDNLSKCDFVFIESNHDEHMLLNGPYPYFLKKRILNNNGHLSNTVCSKFLSQICNTKTSHIMLGHLSKENNIPSLAFCTASEELKKNNIITNKDVMLYVAPHGEMSTTIQL